MAPPHDSTEIVATCFDDIGPERIFHYYEPASRLRAVVVIDTARFGLSAGGVRMAADLTLEEMVRLARAMSYKFAMLDLPCGGAKAGIWLDPSDPARLQVLAAFFAAIRPLTETRAYIPGADMGTSATDFAALHGGGTPSLGEQAFEGMPLEDQLTGYGVVAAARSACEHLGWPLRGARVAIEGFGKVGAGAAKYFARDGAQVVAVSTVHGTLYDPSGLAVERLLALRVQHGDAALDAYAGGQRLPRAALLTLPVDILVPGARPDAIHAGNVEAIAARLIVPAANIPYAAGTVARLQARGIVPIADFVANAGAVLGGLVGMQGGTAQDAFTTVGTRISHTVRRVLEAAGAQHCSAYDAALALAHQQLTPIRK
jgi:glutamate dehydrogenase (NAD(P)+)